MNILKMTHYIKSDFNLKSVLHTGGIQTTVFNLLNQIYKEKNIVEICVNTVVFIVVSYSIVNCF